MLLYGSTDSGHSYKVRSFLLLCDLAHEYRWVDLDKPRPERLAESHPDDALQPEVRA